MEEKTAKPFSLVLVHSEKLHKTGPLQNAFVTDYLLFFWRFCARVHASRIDRPSHHREKYVSSCIDDVIGLRGRAKHIWGVPTEKVCWRHLHAHWRRGSPNCRRLRPTPGTSQVPGWIWMRRWTHAGKPLYIKRSLPKMDSSSPISPNSGRRGHRSFGREKSAGKISPR